MSVTISTVLPSMRAVSDVSEDGAASMREDTVAPRTLPRHKSAVAMDTDQCLLERYCSGDQAAFTVLYGRYRGPLRRFVASLTRDPDQAAEVLQEVWMAVIRGRRNYRPSARFSTYLFSIAHRRLQDRWRRRGRQGVPEDDYPAAVPDELSNDTAATAEDWVHNVELRHALIAAIDQLPPAQRVVFLLKAEADLSLEEIAAVTGSNVEATKSRMRYAVARLRTQLAPWK